MALLVSAHQCDDALHPAPTCTEPECHHCTKKPKLDASPGKGASTTSKPSSTNTTPMPPRPSSPVLTDSTVSLGSFWTDDIPQATIESVENEIRSWRNAILRGETPDLYETSDRWEIIDDGEGGSSSRDPTFHDCVEFLLDAMLSPNTGSNAVAS